MKPSRRPDRLGIHSIGESHAQALERQFVNSGPSLVRAALGYKRA